MDDRFEVEEAQASFRGVAFHVKKRSRGGGRRGPTHEAPQRDEPDGEDLGRKVRTFSVDALIIGDGDSDADRQSDCNRKTIKLIAALEDKAGPGIYRDPWHGLWSVICRSHSAVDDEDRQFVTTLSLSFEESGEARYPLAALDTATGVDLSADALSDASSSVFDRAFSVAKMPQYVLNSANSAVSGLLGDIDSLPLTQLSRTAAMGIGDASGSVSSLRSRTSSLMSGGGLGSALSSLFRQLGSASYSRRARLGDPASVRMSFASLSSWGDTDPASGATSSRRTEAANTAALSNLVRRLAAAEEARALAATTWDSQDQAIAQRNQALGHLDAVMDAAGNSGDDGVFSAAQSLAVAVTKDVAARAPAARVRTASFDTVLPACVIAHKLLGDGTRADDIVRRNGISNPAFVPAKTALEYISDA